MVFYKIFAFIKKSFLIQWSYRLAIFLGILGTFGSLLTFYFIDRLFGFKIVAHLAPYGVNYFSYALIAIAFSGFIGTSLGKVAGQINQEQTVGTLEALLTTPTRIETLIAAMITWDLVYAFVEFALYVIMGILLFRIDFSNINILSTLVITLLSIVSFNSLGIISAGFILVFKKGDPVSWLISIAFELLGGVYFPVTVLPEWLQSIAHLFPITYAIRSVELAIYQGATLKELSSDIFALILFCLFLLPVGILVLKYALNQAKQDGSLIQY
ncbi:MAG: ABC transporter permease [Pseudomonadota bacterium]